MKKYKKIEVVDWVDEFLNGKAYEFTHAGIPHGDEITASIIYAGACDCEDIEIIRISRDDAEKINLAKCLEKSRRDTIVVDMGGGEYDHHDMKKTRQIEETTEGEKTPDFASAGLVWRDFGKQYIRNLIIQLIDNPEVRERILNDESLISDLHRKIDEDIIQPIDARDNGNPINNKREITDFYEDFYPDFYAENPNYNEAFLRTLKNVQVILEYEIIQLINLAFKKKEIKCNIPNDSETIDKEEFIQTMEEYIMSVIEEIQSFGGDCICNDFASIAVNVYKEYAKYGKDVATSVAMAKINRIKNQCIAKPFLDKRIQDERYFRNGIFVIPSQTTPWTDFAIDYNENAKLSHAQEINFVLMDYPTGGFALQCVPPSRDKLKDNKISLYDDPDDPILGLTTIHKNLFFARATSREPLELLALKSVKRYQELTAPAAPPVGGER